MKSILIVTTLASIFASSVLSDQWALLVAGSNSYMNYRHQADVCHAYHILRNHGIPDDKIVVMMYDDIAHNPQNPFPGNIINEPNGKNLYPGVLKDYTGKDVTPEVFLAVLSGDKKGVEGLTGRQGNKVIKSGPEDNVFVYFADHGASGLVAFPDSELHAEDFNNVILKMHQNKQYKEMVIYIEACESGSMFNGILRNDINVYATTAANPDEPSHAFYWDDKRIAFLGDLYSIRWMEDSEVENISKETLAHQFQIVKRETNMSHVMEYGDLSIGQRFVGEFQGNKSTATDDLIFFPEKKSRVNTREETVPSHLVPIETMRRRAQSSQGQYKVEAEKAFRVLLKRNLETKKFFKAIVNAASGKKIYQKLLKERVWFTNFQCYRYGIRTIKASCLGLDLNQNDLALRNLRALANLCESGIPKERIYSVIKTVAGKSPIC